MKLCSPPPDCTQYYTATTGVFQSFNFNSGLENFIANQNYNACFRQAEGINIKGFRRINFVIPV